MKRGLVALACAALWLAGCAPRHGPALPDIGTWRQRFEAQRAQRAQVLACALADLDVRAEGSTLGRLPRLELRVALAAPDRLRLRAAWLLGTAFDLVAEGDSVRALVPARRLAVVVDPEDAPIEAPARLVLRALAASWRVPEAAWQQAWSDSAERSVGWREGLDTLRLAIDGEGLPTRLEVRPAKGTAVDIDYDRWQDVGGVRCPSRLRLRDLEGRMRLTLDLTGIEPRASPGADWFTLSLPAHTQHVGWAQLGRLVRGSEEPW